jgi:ribosome-binding protein aMBF1 (putative translation factor)
MDHQDWKPVVLRKSKPKPQPKLQSSGHKQFTKLDNNDEDIEAPKYLSYEFRQQLQKARCSKKMSQKDLANRINEQTSIVSGYENGKMVPQSRILIKINRILGTRLKISK